MLPSSVFSVLCRWSVRQLEISVSDVFPDGFSFRVPELRRADFGVPPETFRFAFFDRRARDYDRLEVTDFALSECGKGLLRFKTGDRAFINRFARLCREYLEYINTKLSVDEGSLMTALTGRGFDKTFSSSPDEWRDRMLSLISADYGKLLPCEIAVCLDEPAKWNDPGSAVSRVGLTRDRQLTHACIGSNLCPRLFPQDDELERVLRWCADNCITPVICFPPMPEREADCLLDRALRFKKGTEFEINDTGTAIMLEGRGYALTAGPFLNRRKKDPRMACRIHAEQDYMAAGQNSLDADFYREYLKGLGLSRFSYEAAGYDLSIKGEGNVLYLPLYRVSTSLFCPLKAAVETGDRGGMTDTGSCPGYCSETAFMYPDEMRLCGLYNSLMGFSAREIDDCNILNAYIRAGVNRLAVRI